MEKKTTTIPSRDSRATAADPQSNKKNFVAIANQYANEVISGTIPACRQVIQACQRHNRDLARSLTTTDFPFVLDRDSAARACEFLEALPHVKGKWAAKRETLSLQAWQTFIVVSLFGWVERADPLRYRFREASIFIPRKNGKSFLAAGIGLYKFAADGEYAAEVYFGATSEEQSKRLGFKPSRAMALKSPALCKAFGIKVNAHNLEKPDDGSILKPVIARPGDGDSPSCAVIDEYHEHKTAELVDTFKTGMGARENPLLLVITTAGSNRGGPCFQLQKDIERILAGTFVDERHFAIVYTIDAEIDWKSELALRMANPNVGVSIDPEFLAGEQRTAIQSARKQNTFKTKYLNVWVNASVAWIPAEKWKACADPSIKLEDFAGEPAIAAFDLASEVDLASTVLLFKREIEGREHFFAFFRNYLNATAVEEGRGEHYRTWANEGHLIVTDGDVTDYTQISEDLIADSERFALCEVPHDPYHAAALIQFIQKDPRWTQTIEFVKIQQSVANMSPAMKQLEKLVLDRRLHHDGNPVIEWMISNVFAKTVKKDEIFPDKESPERKIDGAIALMMAIARSASLEFSESDWFAPFVI